MTQTNESTALAIRPTTSVETYVNASPEPMKAIESFGRWIAKSGMFGCTREEQGMIIAIACIEMKIGVVEFSQTFDVMHTGKLRKKAVAAHAEFEREGGTVKWIDCGESREKAEVDLTYKGNTRRFTFTLDDAKRANLVKKDGNWETWTADMLCARVLSRGIIRVCPKIFAGFETEDDDAPTLVLPSTPAPTAHVAPAPAPAPAAPKAPADNVIIDLPTHPDNPVKSEASVPAPAQQPPADDAGQPLLTEAEAEDLAAFLGEANVMPAVTWMMKQQPPWLTKAQLATGRWFQYLTAARVARIRKNKDSFLRVIHNPAQLP